MKRTVIVVIVVMLVAGSAAAGYIAVNSKNRETATSALSTTSTSTTLALTSSTLIPIRHQVTFQQTGGCPAEFWGVPWSVTINGLTEVQPPGTQLPLDNNSLSGTTDRNFSTILFSLFDGTYSYSVSPSNNFFTPDSGTFTVSDADVVINVAYTGTSCTTVVTSS